MNTVTGRPSPNLDKSNNNRSNVMSLSFITLQICILLYKSYPEFAKEFEDLQGEAVYKISKMELKYRIQGGNHVS
jgi:hypothetical protein